MAKRNQSKLGIATASRDFGFGVPGTLIATGGDSVHNAERQDMQRLLDKRLVAEEYLQLTTRFGMDCMASITQHAGARFVETSEVLMQLKQEVESPDCQPYVDEFTHHLQQIHAQQLLGAVNLGGTAIAREMVQSPYPPPPPPPPPPPSGGRTWFGRLLLGDDR